MYGICDLKKTKIHSGKFHSIFSCSNFPRDTDLESKPCLKTNRLVNVMLKPKSHTAYVEQFVR